LKFDLEQNMVWKAIFTLFIIICVLMI